MSFRHLRRNLRLPVISTRAASAIVEKLSSPLADHPENKKRRDLVAADPWILFSLKHNL
jgi:hypothetical protein